MNHAPRRKLYQYVVEELGLRIIRGDYQPEETLPNEDALCKEFDVSRGVLREAAKVLKEKGLIRLRPKIGTQIQPRGKWNLFDPDVLIWKFNAGDQYGFLKNITEVRRIIEAEAAQLAAQRAVKAEIEPIRSIHDEMARQLKSPSAIEHEAFVLLDLKFHNAILEASQNELIAQIGYTMRQALWAARIRDQPDHQALLDSLKSHQGILDAITRHDGAAAYGLARTHVEKVWGDFMRRLGDEPQTERR